MVGAGIMGFLFIMKVYSMRDVSAPIAFLCLIEDDSREQMTGPRTLGSSAPHTSWNGFIPC